MVPETSAEKNGLKLSNPSEIFESSKNNGTNASGKVVITHKVNIVSPFMSRDKRLMGQNNHKSKEHSPTNAGGKKPRKASSVESIHLKKKQN